MQWYTCTVARQSRQTVGMLPHDPLLCAGNRPTNCHGEIALDHQQFAVQKQYLNIPSEMLCMIQQALPVYSD